MVARRVNSIFHGLQLTTYSYPLTVQPIQPVQPIQAASLVSSARGESVSCKKVSPTKNLKCGAL